MFRYTIFIIANLTVMFILSIILNNININYNNNLCLIVTTGLFGFFGSLISLLCSKWIALKSVKGIIIRQPSNFNESWLMNAVSKQSKNVGIKTPEIAIYDAIHMNAFATGYSCNSSLIAFSSGLLEKMTKNEIQAVIAHEISHIKNGDMVTIVLLQGLINTFVILLSKIIAKIIVSIFYRNKDHFKHDSIDVIIYFVASIFLELTFSILASIITMWFSRYREFYADAYSARTVGKNNMISALKKLKMSYSTQEPSNIVTFCIHYKSNSFLNLFLSHPPIDKRIKALRKNYYI
ncbi:Zn-dependent protease with chaperone function [Buchnera aphidicola (Nipponaphis monzeni)]|uniref:Zn-dependent protease with chaperone function n=1 Tax=Buchnera aphidicola (Nipponaphis monzeni) TaxID=2495405 RepID=A0A455TAB2_9GAMM|nr:protease HtpX [Buchnera aphidicola]BBI01262.1 Zn-dependent protease with chaperone function [Buchnera aphidicola (Nipponaphis monzeni)]